jgi:Zn-finger nucleic acid-binding protein
MNIPDAGFCSGCGRQLGLEPVGEVGHLPCPLCKQAMQRYRESQGDLFDCGVCAGQFVEHPLLREMIHRHAVDYAPETAVTLPRRPDPRTVYIPCPECTSLMNRKNFGGMSGVVVDVCKKHGTWFDEGELPRVLEFVASGGLERAKRREEEEASRVRRDAAVASVRSQGSFPVEARHEPAALGAAFMASLLELLR